jgi:hypothetical protein
MNEPLHRRMIGWLRTRLPDARLDRVADPRRTHRQKWSMDAMISTVVVGLVAGCRSLADVEALTQEMSPAAPERCAPSAAVVFAAGWRIPRCGTPWFTSRPTISEALWPTRCGAPIGAVLSSPRNFHGAQPRWTERPPPLKAGTTRSRSNRAHRVSSAPSPRRSYPAVPGSVSTLTLFRPIPTRWVASRPPCPRSWTSTPTSTSSAPSGVQGCNARAPAPGPAPP